MTSDNGNPVVVGVDGSAIALEAVRAAAREAVLRRRPLRIVHAFIWPLMNVPLGPDPSGPATGGLRHQAERYVAEAVAEAAAVAPDLPVTGAVVDGAAVRVLLDEACQGALLVLGNRGLGGFAGLLIGSVTVQVSTRAQCPVLVVRGEPRAAGPVVVGVDGSESAAAALGWAVEAAARRGAPLVAVHAWLYPTPVTPGDVLPLGHDLDALAADGQRLLAESVEGPAARHPEVPVQQRLVRGSPAGALVEASRTAQLVVVGARGRGPLAGLLLGSVSHAVLHHAHCPVAVVPQSGPDARP
ncbi:universal stress protein [Micromonospora sp. NPDC049836]|uniref:universal stress protein n=1 Tax=Micromonospora sp. NPDC049836 TaxID=3364274 RepID=UPI0037A650A0